MLGRLRFMMGQTPSGYGKGSDMEAIRRLARVENNVLTVHLPASFSARDVEVIVLPVSAAVSAVEPSIRPGRRPSPKLKGTRLIGDIMETACPESDWNALK